MTSLIQSRKNRLRKLLPELKLENPNDAEMRKLSDLIGTTDPRLADSIKSTILDAHLNDAALRNLSANGVCRRLKSIRSLP